MKSKKKVVLVLLIMMVIITLIGMVFESIALTNPIGKSSVWATYTDLKYNSKLWCAQHGGSITSAGASYNVKTVSITSDTNNKVERALAYILAQNNSKNGNEYTTAQGALWTLIQQNTSAVQSILESNRVYNKKNYNNTNNTIYKEALQFAEYEAKDPEIKKCNYSINKNSSGKYVGKLTLKIDYNNNAKFGGIEDIYVNKQKLPASQIPSANVEKTITLYGPKTNKNDLPQSVKVEIRYNKTIISGNVAVLTNSSKQTLLYSQVTEKDKSDKISTSVTGAYDISLQKYITRVYNDETEYYSDSKNDYDYINGMSTARRGKKVKETIDGIYKDNIVRAGGVFDGGDYGYCNLHDVYNKDEKPVTIKKGNVVVYRIEIYNNGNKEAKKIKVRDRISNLGTILGVWETKSIHNEEKWNLLNDGINDADNEDGFKYIANTNYKKFQYTIDNLGSGKRDTLLVVVRFDSESRSILKNRAWIFDSQEYNNTSYRQSDCDYVQFEHHSVSLEKYITWTNNDAGTNYVQYYDTDNKRDGHPIYNQEMIDSSYKDTYKQDKPALVDSGDRVNYSIKITNTDNFPITVKEVIDEKANELTYISASAGNNRSLSYSISGNKIIFYVWDNGKNGVKLAPGDSMWISVTFRVNTEENNKLIQNYAHIDKIWDESGNHEVSDVDSWSNNYDKDWVKTKQYYAKLEKYISSAMNPNTMIYKHFEGNRHCVPREGRPEYNKHPGEANTNNYNYWKYNNPLEVETGDIVTYDIKVTNEGENKICIKEINDAMPNGVKYNIRNGRISGKIYYKSGTTANLTVDIVNGVISITESVLLQTNEYIIIKLPIIVTEPNISISILKNTAEIRKMININGYTVKDSCLNDNKDSDYIQLKDITISGTVWNDKVFDKEQKNYNAKYDTNKEKPLPNIKVALYRQAKDKNGKKYNVLISSKYTNSEGRYSFSSVDINKMYQKDGSVSNIEGGGQYVGVPKGHGYEKYIKAAKNPSNNRWNDAKEYYAYYIMFEYDGVTYTSTPDGKSYVKVDTNLPSNYQIDSNAREKLNSNETFDGYVQNNRTSFNNKVNPVNNGSTIKYKTKNEQNYIPQSTYDYDATNKLTNMNMYSSTNLIQLSNSVNLEEQLKYVNLGLRGRDIFDLELTSDVDNVKVTVNNQPGVYNYTNKVTLQRSDLSAQYSYQEDMAHRYLEGSTYKGDEQELMIRKGDLNPTDKAGTNTGDSNKYGAGQGVQKIEVTYKITVTNASKTEGTATKIIDYFDDRYSFEKAYIGNYIATIDNKKAKYGSSDSEHGYHSVIITTPGTNLTQSSKPMEIYVVYTLNTPTTTLASLLNTADRISTYNMAEIYEYKTRSYENSSNWDKEFTRGLIDKDSAPGSIDRDRANLTNGNQEPNLSTVKYYFSKKQNEKVDLSLLKYEDDTYATPTLYFTTPPDNKKYDRKITGTVFEDYTVIINSNGKEEKIRTKTGDGKQTGDEPGIQGIKVLLIEKTTNKARYRDYTDKDGKFEFSGFLPGEYYITFDYGINDDTFLYNNNPNTKSYNGEDFQSTNNTGKYGNIEANWIHKLNDTANYWYVFNKNEGVSTAKDKEDKRQMVSKNVTNFTDKEMTVLNNARDGKTKEEVGKYIEDGMEKSMTQQEVESVRDNTFMTAKTDDMLLTVEETVDLSKIKNSLELIKTGRIRDKGNGLGEWCVFPNENSKYTKYNVSNMNFGIAEVPVTTIDLQKHVKSFTIKDSTGNNMIASAQIDKDNTSVTVNASKIAVNRLNTVIKVLSQNLAMDEDDVRKLINYDTNKTIDSNIVIKEKVSEEQMEKLRKSMTENSLAREINMVNAWKVTSGNVLAAPGTSVIDVSIEDEKLQGAKLEVTYEITCNMYAEKNYDNTEPTKASITGMADYIDNDLSYNTNSNENNNLWTVTTREQVIELYKEAAKFKGQSIGTRLGTLDPNGNQYTTIVSANKDNNQLLLTDCGTGTAEITLERVLSASNSSLGDIITSSIDSFEYDNKIEITGLDYKNTLSETTGNFVYRDRVRTPDRYIILAGIQHDTATSERIAIHPPTGENNNMIYCVITVISLGVLAGGIILIKKYAIKIKRNDKK